MAKVDANDWSTPAGYLEHQATQAGIKVTANPDFQYNYNAVKPSEWNIEQAALTGLNFVVDGLNYLNNITQSMMMAGLEGKSVADAAMKAATYKKRTYPEDLKRKLGEKLGVDLTMSYKKGQFDAGDVGDFIADLAIDTVFDPLTYISLGANKVIKSTAKAFTTDKKLLNGAEKVFKDMVHTKVSKAIDEPLPLIKDKKHTLKYKMPETHEAKLALGKKLDVIDEIEINRQAMTSFKAASEAGNIQLGKDVFAGFMGGLYYSAANVEDENDPVDIAKNFAIGAAVAGGGRRFVRTNPTVKNMAASIGQRLNKLAGPKEVVTGTAFDAEGIAKKFDMTGVDGYKMMDLANDTVRHGHNAAIRVLQPFGKVLAQLKEAGPVEYATQIKWFKKFDNYLGDIRNEKWNRTIRDLDPKQLSNLGIEVKKKTVRNPKTGKSSVQTIYPSIGEAKGAGASKVKDLIEQEIRAKYFTNVAGGTPSLNREAVYTWMGEVNDELAHTTFKNLDAWAKAANESFNIEKQLRREGKLRALYPNQETSELIKSRSKSIADKNTNENAMLKDSLTYENIKNAMRMDATNKGMLFWTPRIGERSFAVTSKAAGDATKAGRTLHARQSMSEKIKNGKRDFLGRDAEKAFEDLQTVENAEQLITTFESSLAISAQNKAKQTFNDLEKEAARYAGERFANQKEVWELFTRFNGTVKQGLLLGGYTWVKNNFWSNARQAYANSGLMGLVDSVRTVNFTDDLAKDMRLLYFRKAGDNLPGAMNFKSADIEDMFKYNVIDNPQFRDISTRTDSEEMFKFLWDEETASKVVENRNKFPWLDKFENAGNAMSNLLRTRQLGSYVESMARGTIYQRHVKLLEDVAFDDLARIYGKDAALDTIKKEASRITNEVFYDYGKMSYWERTYARQVIPFYSFYRQNLFYQGQVLFDPKRAKNAAALGRLAEGRYFGADPFTGKDKIFVPEYLKGQSAIRFTDENGEEKIYYSPSDPGQMMYTMLSSKYWFKDFMGQFNPALKSLIEQLSNTDFFRGEPLDPAMLSADPNRQLKFLFSQGYTMMPIYNTVAALLGSKDSVVWPDKNGNPVTDQEWVARVDNIMSWLGAQYLTATKQMYGAAKKMEHGKATGFDTLMNLAGPMSVTRQIESQKERAIDAYYQEKVYGDGYGEQLRRTNRLID